MDTCLRRCDEKESSRQFQYSIGNALVKVFT
jgi:hypothetical protein